MALVPNAATPGGMPVKRVRKAYEQVADQLRELILAGELRPGMRLPTEVMLAREFGVSRATIREALRVLAAHRLIETSKGTGGGSFVTLPSVDHISEFLHANINLLTASQEVSLDEFLEVRELLEVPAARLAAERRDPELLHRLDAATPEGKLGLTESEQFGYNKEFHSVVVEASGNTLLYVAAQPIFTVLQTALQRTDLGPAFHEQVHADHLRIGAAITSGNASAAEREMREHLAFLRPEYERVWRHARHRAEDAAG
ncbi:MAG: FadR/GntR family transcriptional regulator [Solirubrobacteraceae bacterium]